MGKGETRKWGVTFKDGQRVEVEADTGDQAKKKAKDAYTGDDPQKGVEKVEEL